MQRAAMQDWEAMQRWAAVGQQLPPTVCCSDKSRGSAIVLMLSFSSMSRRDSMAPTPANAQQLPQPPWFFTGVTLPVVRQSRTLGMF